MIREDSNSYIPYVYMLEWGFSTFLHESDILDALCKVSEKRKKKISNLAFCRPPPPPFGQRPNVRVFFLTLP